MRGASFKVLKGTLQVTKFSGYEHTEVIIRITDENTHIVVAEMEVAAEDFVRCVVGEQPAQVEVQWCGVENLGKTWETERFDVNVSETSSAPDRYQDGGKAFKEWLKSKMEKTLKLREAYRGGSWSVFSYGLTTQQNIPGCHTVILGRYVDIPTGESVEAEGEICQKPEA